jgi:hypothetical protein
MEKDNVMESSNGLLDKRSHPRVLMDLPLEYQILDAPYAHGGVVANASEAGLLILSIKSMPVGTKLNIAVLFPKEFQLSNFEVSAEIIWKEIHWKEDWEGYKYGLKFIRILDEDQWKLKDLLIEPPEI